jgi:tRNA G18 (ribose-2'-O)-methylase SpoU
MAQVFPVDDPSDERLAPYTRLTDADHRRQVEGRHGTFVIEGVTAIHRALSSPYELLSVLATPAKAATLEPDLPDVPLYVADTAVMEAVVGFDIHRGAVAVGRRPPPLTVADVLARGPAVAVLEGLNDHENLGAIARSAAALGVTGLLLDPTCADPLYRRCVRVSMGEVLTLALARVAPWPQTLDTVRAAGFTIVALTPAAEAEPIDDVAGRVRGRPVALLVGAERHGLSSGALDAADVRARIAMRPGADSLNVGHAAAIAFHRLVGPAG